jgi:hypothetical protein
MALPIDDGAVEKAHWQALATKWDARTRLAAEWLQSAESVADLGCGLMAIEPLLKPGATYVPMDIVPRDSRTIIVDIDRDAIPSVTCDALLMLGVLEYAAEPASLIAQLTRFPRTILSYNHWSLNDILWSLRLREKLVTWKNRLTRRELRRLVGHAGLRIVRERPIRVGERLLEIVPDKRTWRA